jgi:hypothetical protein
VSGPSRHAARVSGMIHLATMSTRGPRVATARVWLRAAGAVLDLHGVAANGRDNPIWSACDGLLGGEAASAGSLQQITESTRLGGIGAGVPGAGRHVASRTN